MRRSYIALAHREAGEAAWSILFPDFPEIASSAEEEDALFEQAQDALATAVDARLEDGEPLPERGRSGEGSVGDALA